MDRPTNANDVVAPRRGFFTRIAASAMAIELTGLGAVPARAAAGAENGADWPGALKGRHRQVVDVYAARTSPSRKTLFSSNRFIARRICHRSAIRGAPCGGPS
jgi:hypothetical protein